VTRSENQSRLSFAVAFLNYLAGHSRDPKTRSRAAYLAAAISLLDADCPEWRESAVDVLSSLEQPPASDAFFDLPEVDIKAELARVLQAIRRPGADDQTKG